MKKRVLIFLSSITMLVLIAINISIGITNITGENTNSLALQFQQANAGAECNAPHQAGSWQFYSETWTNEGTTHIHTIVYQFIADSNEWDCGTPGEFKTEIIYVYEK